MGQQNRAILTTELSQQITACTFSKDDLKTLCEILQESSYAAAEEEITNYTPLDRPTEQILADRESLRSGFELKVTVRGIDDKVLLVQFQQCSTPLVFRTRLRHFTSTVN